MEKWSHVLQIFLIPETARDNCGTANILVVLSTVKRGVTFPTVIWRYSEPLMVVYRQ